MKPSSDFERTRAREICVAILEGKIGILEGVRLLFPLAHTDAIPLAEDRTLIIAIESETDDLPIGDVRKLWRADVLAEKDLEIGRCEALWRDQMIELCRRVAGK